MLMFFINLFIAIILVAFGFWLACLAMAAIIIDSSEAELLSKIRSLKEKSENEL